MLPLSRLFVVTLGPPNNYAIKHCCTHLHNFSLPICSGGEKSRCDLQSDLLFSPKYVVILFGVLILKGPCALFKLLIFRAEFNWKHKKFPLVIQGWSTAERRHMEWNQKSRSGWLFILVMYFSHMQYNHIGFILDIKLRRCSKCAVST